MPRILAIGDVHGCSRALDVLLADMNPHGDDRIVTLGDYVDRGPDSKGVLDRLLDLHQTGRLIAILGNHEIMMLQARRSPLDLEEWSLCGGDMALASYGTNGRAGTLADVPERHWEFMETTCVGWYEAPEHFFVHANAYPDLPFAAQPDYMLFWEPFAVPVPHESGKIMVCGHTAQKSGQPLNRGHAVCIDTWVYGKGWLTCLDVTSGKVWQANQRGERRTAHLDDFLFSEDPP